MRMTLGPDFCRDMHRVEEPAVDQLLRTAFGGEDEVKLVHRLRKSGAMVGEMVLPFSGTIGGYAALSRLAAPRGWIALGPVAVAPELQKRGNGKRMVGLISEWARITKTPVIVVGAVPFYARAGFSKAAASALDTPYPNAHTLLAGVTGVPLEKVIYPKAFAGV